MNQSDTYSAPMLSFDFDGTGGAQAVAEARTGPQGGSDDVSTAGTEGAATAAAGAAGDGPAGEVSASEVRPDTSADETVGYRGTTAYSVAGISYRQLDYWARTGLVVPSVRDASGSGTQRLYSFRDIVVLKVVKRLLDAGVSLQNIRKAIETLRRRGEDDLANVTLISDGTTVYECRSAEEIVDLLQGGQGVFAIALSGPFREIQGTLAELPAAEAAEAAKTPDPAEAVDELAARRARRRAG